MKIFREHRIKQRHGDSGSSKVVAADVASSRLQILVAWRLTRGLRDAENGPRDLQNLEIDQMMHKQDSKVRCPR